MTVLAAQDAFDRARKTYIELLTAKERTQIEAPTSLAGLLSQTETINKTLTTSHKPSATQLSRRLGAAASKLQPFERILEGVVKTTSPQAGNLIWGSVSFVLELARNNADVFDETMNFFLEMADEMEYVKLLETTFKDVHLVVSVIESLYVAILDFWVKAVKYYRPKPSKRDRILSGITNFVSSGYMLQKFQKLKADIATQKGRLHHVTSAQHYVNSASYHLQGRQEVETARRLRLVTWINAPSYESDFHTAEEKYHSGTCEWILKREGYVEWIARKENPLLVIYGIPGAGKTILSSWLINQAQSRAIENEGIVLYHFFKASDDSKNTPMAAIRSLINQLYDRLRQRQHVLLSEFESDLEGLSSKNQISFMHLWGLFSSSLTRLHASSSVTTAVTVILDAMDECKGTKPFVRELHKQVHAASGLIRVIVTSRKSGDHVDEFARAPLDRLLVLEITKDNVKHDIASFTKYKITKIERLQGHQHSNLRNSLIAELGKVENHQGMFLWTYLMCKEVKHMLQIAAIWRLVKNLPKGLDAMYARICNRLAENDYHREFGRNVLQWIVASSRPLRFGELEQALKTMQDRVAGSTAGDFFDDQAGFDEEYGLGLLWSRKDIVEACGDLVTYTGLDDGDMIGLVHLSARHFLCCNPRELSLPPDLMPSLANISTFLVDIPRAESELGATCLEYLLGETLHSDAYFKRPVGFEAAQRSHQGVTKRHPFFDYSLVYWPEYASSVLSLSGNADISLIASKTLLFIAHPFSVMWLEEYIRQFGIESTAYIIRRFSELPQNIGLREIFIWAERAEKVLVGFSNSLPVYPSMIRTCLPPTSGGRNVFQPHSQSPVKSEADVGSNANSTTSLLTIPPLERVTRGWLHYDSITDSLISVDSPSDTLSLKRQVMTSGVRLRPAVLDTQESGTGVTFFVRSAAVSARMGFIAITFASTIQGIRRYTTVCWSLITSGTLTRPSEWAEVAFVDHTEGQLVDKFESTLIGFDNLKGAVVAFTADNTLVAPGGIWDILSEERRDGPPSIFDPDPELAVRNTSFSGDGERVTRITTISGRDVLEVLDMCGDILRRMECPSGELTLTGISHTGRKIVFRNTTAATGSDDYYGLKEPTYGCFETEGGIQISIPMPQSRGGLRRTHFTKNEDRMISLVDGLQLNTKPNGEPTTQGRGSSIVIWTFVKDDSGQYLNHASMIYLFKSYDDDSELCLARSLVSRPSQLQDSLIIAQRSGLVHKRLLTEQWSCEEEHGLFASYSTLFPESRSKGIFTDIVLRSDASLELLACFRDTQWANPTLGKWLLGPKGTELIATTPTPTLQQFGTYLFTSTGRYLTDVDNHEFYQLRTSSRNKHLELSPLELPFASDTVLGCAFASDDTRVVLLHADGDKHMLTLYDIIDDKLTNGQTSQPLDIINTQLNAQSESSGSPVQDYDASCSRITFSSSNIDLLVVSYCTDWDAMLGFTFSLTLVNGEFKISKINDQYMATLKSSICGFFVYDNVPFGSLELHRLPCETLPTINDGPAHPILLRVDSFYVSSPHILKLEIEPRTGALFLNRKQIDQDDGEYQSRLICVRHDDIGALNQRSTLVWPPKAGDKFELDRDVVLILPLGTNEPTVINTGIRSSEMMREEYWFSKPQNSKMTNINISL
ncbi:hypothetical protein C0991_002350 [Blastosporella zonata]|nr:hypothetical protein C0991_002350 [Blastosporella zonata]